MTDLSRVVRFTQIATLTMPDQIGKPVGVLYALDASGALWATDPESGWWKRVVQPANFDGNPFTNTTRGRHTP